MTNNWQEKQGRLTKNFVFGNFNQAIKFINQVAALSEKADHHPDICLYDYKNVKIILSTHQENKITEKDYELAKKIDQL